MKTCLITLTYNEEEILPYIIPYWKRLNLTKIIVYDNHSTDKTTEILQTLPNVEIREFDSQDTLNDVIQKQVKEEAYKQERKNFDLIIISDADEVFCFKNNKILENFVSTKYTFDCLIAPTYSLVEDNLQPPTKDDELPHQMATKFFHQKLNHQAGFEKYSKFSIFNCKRVKEIRMSVGQHFVQTLPKMNIVTTEDGFALHFNKGISLDYYLRKKLSTGKRLSDTNIKGGMGIEYLQSKEEHIKDYKANGQKSFNLNTILIG